MRAALVQRSFNVAPGRPFKVAVDVVNSHDVIDGAAVRLVGLPGAKVSVEPGELALFPAGSGTLTATVELPRGFLAGTHEAAIEVTSRVFPDEVVRCAFDVEVLPVTQAVLHLLPASKSGHRRGRFSLVCDNEGNTPVALALDASDPERALRLRFEPALVEVDPCTSAQVALIVRARRQLFGSDRARPIVVAATGSGLELEAKATYVQRPTVPRGMVTVAILAMIVALWAGAFFVGIHKVLAENPMTKDAPLSFFAANQPAGATLASATSGATPTGFQPKNEAPLGVGGSISGRAFSPGLPAGVGRITVQAVGFGGSAGQQTTAATQSDGSYELAGLFPGSYHVVFFAPGFKPVWYPNASSAAGATTVFVGAQIATPNVDATIVGLPGSIDGQIITGESPSPPVTVTVLANNVPVGTSVTSDASGHYVVSGLASPATYTLAYTAPGFQ